MSAAKHTDLIAYFTTADDAACEAAAIALGQQAVEGLATLAELLAAVEADARFWAVRGLWANGTSEAVVLLIKTLSDQEEMVRCGAALALGELKAEAAVKALARLCTTNPAESGNHAADALAKIGQAAAPALIEAMQNEHPWVRVRAARALISVKSKQAIPALFQALDDDSYIVRHHAEEALARMGVGQMVYFWV
ncbi:MAG: HEAT repeat domain-containing protein [Chloroflexi bacterium]|nr:HEAT repeat domain-containing protein [Chloroflexota bacterium]